MKWFSLRPPKSQFQDIAVVIQIGKGSFAEGFQVAFQVLEGGKTIDGVDFDEGLSIPSASDMRRHYEKWQSQSYEGSRRLQTQLLSDYDLNLMQISTTDALPKTGKRLVVAAKIRDSYHVRIFDHAGRRIIDSGQDRFSPDATVIQQLDVELRRDGTDTLSKNRLVQQIVSSLGDDLRSNRLTPIEIQYINVSLKTQLSIWRSVAEELTAYCQKWFKAREFGRLRDRILSTKGIHSDVSVPIIVYCDKNNPEWDVLQRLPYHLWDLHDKLPNSEFAMSTGPGRPMAPLKRPVRALALIGSAKGGLRLEKDTKALNVLKRNGVKIKQVSEPTNDDLGNLLSDDKPWDILFFAGHSSSAGVSGQIVLREDEPFGLENLRPYLVKARAKGLKLAIFNSCDGMKIAEFLKGLDIPNIIAMKEPVPDDVACLFLIEFLKEFSKGTQLCQAVRQARQRLALEQSKFPAASWLPTVWLNPSAPELVLPRPNLVKRPQLILGAIALASIFAAAIPVIIGDSLCQQIPARLQRSVVFRKCSVPVVNTEAFVSIGDRIVEDTSVKLIDPYLSLKEAGVDAFATGAYDKAVAFFDSLREQARNNKDSDISGIRNPARDALQDPETLIYRNNAFVKMRHAEQPTLPLHTIALAAPLNTPPGKSIALGVAQAQDIAIQQGINLQVVIANDSNKREQAQKVAEYLSQDQQILAVVGHYTSPNTCAALNVYSPNNLVIVSPASTMVNLPSNLDCGGDRNQVFLRTVSNTRIEAETLIEHLIEELRVTQPKVVVFYNANELFSSDMYEQFRQVLNSYGGTMLAAFDLSDPNFKVDSLPSVVKQANAIAVLPDGGTDSRDALDKAVAIIKLSNGEKPILGSNPLYRQPVIDAVGDALINRLFLAVDWHVDMCGAETFTQQVREYWGGDLNRIMALAYEAVQVIASVLPLTSDTEATRQNVRQKLYATGIKDGAAPLSHVFKGRTISFGPNGDRIEITSREIATVDKNLRLALAKGASCPTQ